MAKDGDLFKVAMADVTPLKKRGLSRKVVSQQRAEEPSKASGHSSPRARRGSAPGSAPLPFDRDVDRALARGKRAPEATLDLHGMTVSAAERAVARFLAWAVERDLRVVLIVTGKGWRQEDGRFVEGRIRSEFPAWLARDDNRVRVRGVKSAHLRHGGAGAFYVLLRRKARDPAGRLLAGS
jgi:DNA-nicking Smr family endonuclease